MRHQRVISVFTLAAFLPLSVGCTTAVRTPIHSKPIHPTRAIGYGKPVAIESWTDREGTKHSWDGFVQAVTPDSLEFTRGERIKEGGQSARLNTTPSKRRKFEQFRLGRSDVASVEIARYSETRTAALVSGIVVVVLVGLTWALIRDFERGWDDN
jgi:hypothetical protein